MLHKFDMNVEQQHAYLIHSRKYTDSRILVEFVTEEYGRISGVLRQSGKSSGKSKNHKVQAFTPYVLSWKGNASLKTITQVESLAAPFCLSAENLFCGMYLNEVLLRALPQDDECRGVFELYARSLKRISELNYHSEVRCIEQVLREFEFGLLNEMGFGIDFYFDAQQSEIGLSEEANYIFSPNEGFVLCDNENIVSRQTLYSSSVIIALREKQYNKDALRYAKALSRHALSSVIGDKPIKARELFS